MKDSKKARVVDTEGQTKIDKDGNRLYRTCIWFRESELEIPRQIAKDEERTISYVIRDLVRTNPRVKDGGSAQ